MPQIQGVRVRGQWGEEGAGPQGSTRPEDPYAIRWGLGLGLGNPRKVGSRGSLQLDAIPILTGPCFLWVLPLGHEEGDLHGPSTT